jgi:hypothetical protein
VRLEELILKLHDKRLSKQQLQGDANQAPGKIRTADHIDLVAANETH